VTPDQRRFPVRLQPGPLEGPAAFELREAEANQLRHVEYRRLGGGHRVAACEHHRRESDRLSFNAISTITQNRQEHPECWVVQRGRVCPLCLGDQTTEGSVGWEIRFADACATHGCWLVDRCRCGSAIRVDRARLHQCCQCGGRLASLTTTEAPNALTEMARLLVAAASGRRHDLSIKYPGHGAPQALSALHFADLHLLTRLLGVTGDPHAASPQLRSIQQFDPLEQSWSASTLAAEVLCGWPQSFHDLLEWHRRTNDVGDPYRLQRMLGHLYEGIFRHLRGESFDFVRDELQVYLMLHWRGSTARASRIDEFPLLKRSWISAHDTAQLLGISPRTVRDYIERGDLTADCRTTPMGRQRVVIDRNSIEALQSSRSLRVLRLEAAARLLGMKEARLRRILPRVFPTAWRGSGNQWNIPRPEVQRLLDVTQLLPSKVRVDSHEVTLDHALRYLRLSDASLAGLLTSEPDENASRPVACLKGEVGVAGWIYSREALIPAGDTESTEDGRQGLSVVELSKQLNLKQEVVYFLCRVGAIPTEPSRRFEQRGVLVPWESIQRFRNRFVAARDIARAVGRLPRAVIVAIGRAGIGPAYGPAQGCRQAFYLRNADLEARLQQLWGPDALRAFSGCVDSALPAPQD
jgi:hypothetical protein